MRAKMGARATGSAGRFLPPVAIAAAIAVALSGCWSQPSSNQALDEQFKKNPEFQRRPVARFAGTVTVDGQPPEQGSKLFIILTDFQHLDANSHLDAPKLYCGCDAKGAFAFGTYERADGVPAGKYVVTFVELNDTNSTAGASTTPRDFRSKRSVSGAHTFRAPDLLKNLYNDPEKNSTNPQFVVELNQLGKDDFKFDLTVAGQEVMAAAPNAVTSIRTPH
jgi:hypothetical protein